MEAGGVYGTCSLEMASTDVLGVVDSVIESLQPGACEFAEFSLQLTLEHQAHTVSEEAIHSLHALFPNTLVLAAFDLIDREKGAPPTPYIPK